MADVRITKNVLLNPRAPWYVVRGPHDFPLGGPFVSKEEARAWLDAQAAVRDRHTLGHSH